MAAGEDLGIRPFGARALGSLRLEKGFGSWATEFRPIYGPFEAGLDRFVDLGKNDFIGRDAALRERDTGPQRRLTAFVVEAEDADVFRDEAIWHDGKVVGWVTSGGYAHHVGRSLALGYVPSEVLDGADDEGFAIEILGARRPARVQPEPIFDSRGERMRG